MGRGAEIEGELDGKKQFLTEYPQNIWEVKIWIIEYLKLENLNTWNLNSWLVEILTIQ